MTEATLTRTGNPFTDNHGLTPTDLLDALHATGRALMDQHGLTDWTLAYDTSRGRRLGSTKHARKTIVLSASHMVAIAGAERRDTVLHEIAHALCTAGDGHGRVWQIKALRIGANPRATAGESASEATADVAAVIGTCPMGHTVSRGRMPAARRGTRLLCSHRDHPRSQPAESRLLTWERIAADPVAVAAAAKYPEPKPQNTLRPGQDVQVQAAGTNYDGRTATVLTVGKVNATVQMHGLGRLRGPIEVFVAI